METLGMSFRSIGYKRIEDASHVWHCNNNPGLSGKGLTNTWKDPARATRTGMFGEVAVCSATDEKPQLQHIKGGDKGDLFPLGAHWSVKCMIPPWEGDRYDFVRIGYKNLEHGFYYPMKAEYQVFCQMEFDDRSKQEAHVKIVGWLPTSMIEHIGWKGPSKDGVIMNYFIKVKDLYPIHDLVNDIRGCKGLPYINTNYLN